MQIYLSCNFDKRMQTFRRLFSLAHCCFLSPVLSLKMISLYVTPKMGDWMAYASVGGSFSVYNSGWGGYLSSLLHEIG